VVLKLSEFYHEFASIILPLHIVSAIVLIGSMIGYVWASYPAMKQIPNEKLMIRTGLRTLRRLLNLSFIVSVILVVTGIIIAIGANYADKDPLLATIISTKEALWIFMFFNTIFSFYKILQSKKECLASNSGAAKDNVRLVSNYLIVINIFLGLIASYFGMMLRN
jgi:uncharacterized membrane protein